MALTNRQRFPVLLILIIAALALFLAGAPARAQEGSAPDAPTGLTVASVSHDSVELDWDDSGDSSITHYQVFRRDRAVHDAGEFVIIEGDTGSTATEYTDATVEADEEYVYRVKAVNAYGASPWSDHVRADTPTGPGQETVYTYEDGDRTIRVILQGVLVLQETGADTPSDGVVRRAAGGNIVRQQSGDGGADLPVFRSSGGALMTLPGGVLLALDPEWDEAMVNGFFARNNIWKGRVSELDYIPNGFFVRTEPGFPSLELANALAGQKGVLVSSPNWWREVGTRQEPGETDSDGGEAAQEAGGINPRNSGFDEAYNLTLDNPTGYFGSISPANDIDYFKLDLSGETGTTDVRINIHTEIFTFVELYDSDRESLMETYKLTRDPSLLASLPSGVYYVTVRGPGSLFSGITVTGDYRLWAFTVTATNVSLGSSVAASIGSSYSSNYFKLDLSGQTEDTDVSVFTVSDDFAPQIEGPSGSLQGLQNVDALGDRKWVVYWSGDNLSPGVHLFRVHGDGDTGDYTLRVAAVPDHGSTTATAADLNLDAPTSGKLTSATDADYFKLVLPEAKNLAIMAFSNVNPVMFDSGATEIPVNIEIADGGYNAIVDDFASGTHYVKIASTAHIDTTHTDDGTLVSNTSQLRPNTVQMQTSNYAQAFTTGANAAGYALSSVKVVSTDAAGDGFTVAVYTVDGDGHPDTPHALLTTPDSFAAGTLVFTALANATLEPNTTYALVFDVSSSPADVGITLSNDEDSDAAAGWSIANTYYLTGPTGWEPASSTASIRIAIEGAAAPVSYALYAYEDTGYGTWFDGCADDTEDLGISTINDPLYACQWHLKDINVESVWAGSITGAGVNVAVVDDTIDYSHADLSDNINSALNHDYGARSNAYRPAEHHGTNVAGVIAARDNTIGVRGVVPRATIYGHNLLADGQIYATDMNEVDAMSRNRMTTAVSNNSWGPADGFGFDKAPALWGMAIDSGVKEGYAGKGVFYAWAGGNGHQSQDNSNFDEYANYYGVTAVCAVGDDGARAAYSERGANLWVCAPSDGGYRSIVTTENSDRYTNTFGGTSSATPKVAGVAALLRHANPDLTWRDLKLILAGSARKNDPTNTGWRNGARKYGSTDSADRYHFNHGYGFGVVDAAAAVALAQDWSTLPEFKNASSASGTLNSTIPEYPASGITSSLSLDTEMDFTEFVEVTVTIDHPFWRDLRIELVSPTGTVSTLALPLHSTGTIPGSDSTFSPGTFRFGSAKHLGEDPNGTWTLRVADELASDQGTLTSWSIKVYGHRGIPDLVVESPSVSDSSLLTGASFTLRATVRNQGGSEAASSTLTYYRSTDDTIDTNDSSVGTDPVSGLAVAGTSAESIDLTAPSTTGTYYYGACVDAVTNESDTTNNCSAAVAVTVVGPPDLVVVTPTVTDSSPLTGASFTLRATVRNQGGSEAASSTLTYYRSTDDTIDTNDSSVGTDPVSGLAVAGTSAESIDLTAPSTTGTYYYGACVDAVTNESDTTNNCSAAVAVTVVGPPDLVVVTPTVTDSSPLTGASFTLRATVRNQGGSEAAASTLRYYRSTNATIDTNDSSVGTDPVSGLAAAGTSAESINLTAPSTAGTYYYGACVSTVTNESATGNNCSTAVRVTVVRRPDLVVGTPTVSDSSLLTGASFTLRATVRNQGGSEAAASTLRYYRSTNATIDTNDSSVGTDTVSSLSAGASSAQSTSVIAPATAGTYYYGACVSTVTNESATGNNCSAAVRVTVVGPPDLVVVTPTVSDSSPLTGASFTLRATVRNHGGAAAGSTILTYYRSSDATIATNDTSVGTDTVSSLSAGNTSAQSTSVTAPATAGTYYYGACVRAVADESDTTNNCSTAVAATVVAPPDLVVVTPTVSDSSLLTGASFTLRATVSNQGGSEAAASTLRYYRSSNATIDTNDSSVGTDTVSSLSAGNTSVQSTSVTAPSTAGTYYYGACVFPVADESATGNNCSAAVRVTVVGPPDLVVVTPSVSDSSPLTGASFDLSATVRNQGGSAASSTTLRYYRSTDSTISSSDTPAGTDSVSGLGAGNTSAESIRLTAPATAGTYYYGACVSTVTNESATGNNCSAAVRVTVTSPDLVVDPPTVSDSSLLTGASFTLSATVRNQGNGAAGSSTLRYYGSSDATITTSDTYLGMDPVIGLGAGADSPESISVIAPSTAGTYYYGACVNTVTNESAAGNNCSTAVRVTVVGPPDLVVVTPTVSDSSPLTGASFTLRATVRNQGGAAAGSTTLRYYRSTDSTISSSDTPAGTDSVSSLGAGASSAQSIRLTAPATTGTYYYGACVGTVSGESATTNNCSAAVTVTVTAPDLVVEAPTVSDSSPLTGASFTLRATVRNQGGAAAGSTTLRYYRSTDSTISSSDTPAGTDSVSSLGAGNTSAESISLAAPATAGTYYYGACVGTVTNESDTANNCSAAVRVTVVAPPDLVVGTPTVSNSNPAAGMALTLNAMVRNQGGSTAGSTTLTYYRSTNPTIATNDTSVGTDPVSGLGAGSTSAQSTSVTAPATAGTYYYGACVGRVTNESDTTNNCSVAVAVTVGAAPAPDLVVEAPSVSDSSPLTGASFTLRATVRNLGSGAAGSSTLRYYRSSDATISTSDTLEPSTAAVGVLRPGATVTQAIPLTAPFTTGTYYYYACVDMVTDESNTGNNCSAPVAVTVGVAPVFSEGAGTERSVAENTVSGMNVGPAVTATDADNDTLTYSLEGTDADSFSIMSTRGQIQTSAELNHEARPSYSVTVRADDGKGGRATIGVTIRVTDVNEPPTVDGEDHLTIFENDDLIASYSASDPEGVASTFTWSVAGTDRGDFNIDRNTGELTFRNTPNYESPADSNRDNVYVFTVRATDEGGLSGSLEVTATVANVDEPPTITGSATPPDFPENGVRSVATYQATDPEERTIAWGLSGTDSDDFNINEGVLTFANIPDFEKPTDSGGNNVYNVVVQASDDSIPPNTATLQVTVTVINAAGVEEPSITTSRPSLTLQENGTGTIFTFRARDPQGRPIAWSLTGADESNFTISDGALTFNDSPNFEDPADANGDNVYELTVVVTDEQGLTDSFEFTVTVTNHHENREPAITTSPSSGLTYQKLNHQENRTSTVHTYRARNYGPGSISWTLRGADFSFFDISPQGALTFKNAPNYETLGSSDGDNDYEIAVVASNSGGYSDELNVVITVTDVNEGPEISRVGSAPGSVPENQDRNQVLSRYTATDPENPSADITRWSTSGSDGGDFVISEQGELRFRNTPDFERPADSNRDNEYVFTVRAYDGRYYGSFDVTVTVTDVNEPPTITTTGSSATALRQNENVTSRLYTYRATDPEGADTVTWSVVGVDKDFFTIDERGQFSFKEENAPDFEDPADSDRNNVYNVVVQATDDDNNTAPLDVTVTVREVNEGPEVTSGSPSFTISENQDLPNAVYTGFDPEGGTVTRWTVGGTDGGDFIITDTSAQTGQNSAELTFRNTPDFERPADSNRDSVYEVTVRPYDGRYYGSFDVTVTVTDVNEPPTITTTGSSATALRQNENVTSRLYTYRATDPEGADTVTWSVEGVDKDFFTIDERGQFSFKEENAPDFEDPADSDRNNVYNVVVQATDDDNNTAPLDVTVTVREVNEGPEVTSGSPSFTISENQDLPNAVYTGFDPEGGTVTRWTVGGTDGGDFIITDTSAQTGQNSAELTFRNTPDFERPADSNRDSVYEVTVRPYDGRYYGSFDVTVTVTDVNEPPTITTTSSSATALRQNENVTSRLYTYRATDPEGADTVTWSVEGVDKDFFTIDERGQFSFKEENAPDFEDPADSDRNNVYNVVVQATDDDNNTAPLDVTVTVREVNEGPEVTSGSPSFTISENQDLPNAVYTGFDPEGGTVTRWTVGGTDGGDFIITDTSAQTGQNSAELTFRNTPDFERPADSNRDSVYEVTVRPYDGRYYGSFDVTVTVTDVNEPPTITTTSSSATALRQNENVTSRLYTYRATDPEGADTVTWSVEGVDKDFFTIDERGQFSFKEENAPNFEDPADSDRNNVYNVVVQATDDDNNTAPLDVTVTVANDAEGEEPTITTRRPPATYRENDTRTVYTFRASDPQRGATITWTLEGTDREDFTITADSSGRGVLAFISPPDYENPEDSDRGSDYELTVIATDEDSHVDRLSFTIIVTEVDEGPEVSGPSSFSINENESLPDAVYTARDPEGSNVARWSVGGRDGGDFFITQGGTLYFRSPPDYERPADSDRDNVYEVTIQPSDGRNNGAYPVTVTVGNVNEPPEIRSGSKTSFMQPENRTSRLHTYSAADPEGGTVTWAVVGPDAGLFTIDERGQFSFREENPPDFDNPGDVGKDNVYDVTIQARDPQSKTASLPVTVTVTEVNEGPVITRDGDLFGSPPGSVPENTPVTQVLATYTATDPERPSVKITRWSTSGRDGGDFVINALGELMFRNPPDHERPADSNRDNVYEVTVRASDGRNTGTLEEVQRVTVTGVDEAPTITTTSRTSFTQPEDRTSTLYTFRATDPEGEAVTWVPGGTDGSAFTIDERGALSFTNQPDFESPTDSGGDNVYEVTIQASDGRNRDTLDVTVTVTDHNDGVEPTISTRRPPATYRENDTRAVYTFRASDPQRGATITWKLEGTDREDFTLDTDSRGRAVLAFRNSPDFESPADADQDNVYELAVVATDEEGNSDRLDFAIIVTDHNEGVEPTISTRRPPATYRENDTGPVYTFRASDPQRGTTINWTLEGTDAEDFTLTADDSGRGALAFRNLPDFENPVDAGQDNVYELAVVAADNDGNSDRVDFAITVTDVNEGPVITLEGTATTSVPENTADTKVLADYTATDPEDPTANIFRWSTAGRDGGDFVISDLGELRFRSSPDYERPADSDRNNVYELTVRAYDGRVYGAHDVTVTVTQVNEAPVITTKSRTEFTLRENFTAVLYTYRATDQDEDDAVTWSVKGADGGDFAIYKGILNFRLLPDLENPADADEDNVYEITVVAADRAGLRDTVDAVITITDQSEGPVIAGPISYTVAESYDIAGVLGSYTATDAKDNRPVHPRWSLSGRDGGDFTINEDGELTFRNIPDYDRPADANRDSVYEVTVRGHDSRAYGNLNVTVTVTDVNEHDPVVTGRETLSFRENTAVETRLHTYRATDGDRDTSFIWSLEGDDEDDFAIDQGGVLTFSAPPDYEGPADKDNDSVYRVTVVASDDGAKRGTLGVTVTVTEQNEGPVVSGTPEFTVVENQHLPRSAIYTARDPEAVGGVATTIRWSVSGRDGGDFTIHRDTGVLTFRTPPDHERPADADRNNVYEVTVRAHDGRNYGNFQVTVTVEDVAEITGPAAITRTENFKGDLATYSPAGQGDLAVEPSWRLTGADSGDFTIDRESGELTFRSTPDHERPADSNRDNVYNFTVQVSDGSYHGTLDVIVTVDAVNEPPVVTGRDSLSFRENTPVTTHLHTYRATDPEGDDFAWDLGGLDASDFTITTDSSGRGVLTFASPPNFDIPSGSGAHVNEYLVTVVASDGTNRGTLDVTVTVTDQNEGAVVTGDQTIAVRENQDPAVTLATYSATDPENQPITRWSLSGSDGGDFLISPTGELTFRNMPDYDRPADSNRDNEYMVTVRAYDGRTYGSLDVTITVSNVNEHAPVIRKGSRTSFTYREEGTAALYTYRATDGDKDDTITWTTKGTDSGDFTINGDTGELTFRTPPDHEQPADAGQDNVYNLTVVATDIGRLTDSLDVIVTVTAVDEGPKVTGMTTYTVPEGQELAGARFTAQDPEDASAAVSSWRLAGSDAGDFTITGADQNSAQLAFRNPPDYDRPADSNRDNEYLVTIRAYNGNTYGSLDVTVTVTDENEAAPVVTGRDTLTFRENTPVTTRLYTYRATDTDRDTEITWSVEGDDGNNFAIEEGVLTFSAPPDYEVPTDSDGNNVYQVMVVASDSTKRGTLDVIVTVTDVNEGPVIEVTSANTDITAEENTATDRVLATYAATDPEDPDLEITRWSVTGRDGGDFTINEDGELTFRNPPDHERPADSGRDNMYEVTVRASDGRVYGAHDVTVTVEAVDEAPEFRSGSRDSFSYRENGTAALYTYRATDPEGAEVAWSVSGADGGAFTIDRNTGVLNFREPPDHDDPADDGRDNEYLVTVVATDQTGRAASLPVTVTVTDVNEGPEIAETGTNTAITVDENYDQVLATYSATDPEDPTAKITRWSVTGRDGGDFTISESGELSFRNPPDSERPADANRDSVYDVTVRASDGRYYGTLDVVVTVEAVDEAPEFQRNTQDSFVYPENGASAIYTYRASDPEGSDVTWGLSGTDSGAFSIGKTGVLTFNSPPDYEDPADRDDDNVYQVVVQASDDSSPRNTASLDVTVTVTNLTDARAVIRGTAQVGRTLTAETSGIPDEDRRDRVDFSYQWLADDKDIEGATDPTYEITERDEGKAIKVRVTFTDNAGKEETLTSAATAPVKPAQSNEPAAGLPTISGTAQVGETLTADTSGISDADGMTNAVFRYQWTRWDGDTDEDIEGATDPTYEVSDEDEGKTIRLRVGFSDDRGNDEALTSAATGAVAARPAQLTATFPASPFQSSRHKGDDDRPQVIVAFNLPVQSFDKTTPSVSLTGATVSSLVRHEEDGLENAWVFFLDPEGNDVVVFTLVAGQSCDGGGICTGEGKMLSEGGTITLPGPDEEDKPDNTDSNEPNSPATGLPTINGTAQVGETLTADTSGIIDADGLSNVQYEYQWLADDAEVAGATGSTYTLTDSEESKTVKVQVSFTDDADNEELLTSAATGAVAGAQPTEPPTKPSGLSATASHDSVTLTWDDPGDDTITGYVILRRIPGVDPEGQFDELVADTGTAATTYTDDTVSAETRYTYRIKAINEHGVSERSRWVHIDTPVAPAPEEEQAAEPPAKATGLSSEVSHNMVILTWDDPNDDSITGYLILRRDKDIHEEGTFLTVAPDTGSSETTYVDASVEPERRYVYRIKAINASGVSEIFSWVRAYTPAVPDPAPEAPSKPTSLSATFSHDSVTLTWDDPDDDSITGYVILRRDKDLQPEEGTFFTVTSDTGSAETTFTDDTAEPDKRYVYRIKAINEHGEMSEISSWVRAYTPAAA